jgi:hypothetical protein
MLHKIVFIIILLIISFYFTRVTPKSVAACVEQTGWSAERCQQEIGR